MCAKDFTPTIAALESILQFFLVLNYLDQNKPVRIAFYAGYLIINSPIVLTFKCTLNAVIIAAICKLIQIGTSIP